MNLRRRFKYLIKNADYIREIQGNGIAGKNTVKEYINGELLRLHIIGSLEDIRRFLEAKRDDWEVIKGRTVKKILRAAKRKNLYLNLNAVTIFFEAGVRFNLIPFSYHPQFYKPNSWWFSHGRFYEIANLYKPVRQSW